MSEDDPHAWLEEVDGERALAWVRAHNERTLARLEARPEYEPVFRHVLGILDSKDKIPAPQLVGDTVYNFWKDEQHERGLWRRTTRAEYGKPEPAWETVLDVDALARDEGVPWVFHGASTLPPEHRRAMVSLSRGGSDASVEREFDLQVRAFVEGGFALPEAKSSVAWRDADTLWVGTDFGAGSLTTSGYPRVVKLWTRGTPLSDAETVFEGEVSDVASYGSTLHAPEGTYDLVVRMPTFYRRQSFLWRDGRLVRLDLPEDAELQALFRGQLLVSLRTPWTVGGRTYDAGALLAVDLERFLDGDRALSVLFQPEERVSLGAVATTRDRVLLSTLDNVRGRLATLAFDGAWQRRDVALPGPGTNLIAATSRESPAWFFSYQDFLTPSSLWAVEGDGAPARVRSMPSFFDATGMAIEQREATSADGTRVPYFLVLPPGFVADGHAPTLLYGYGGFEVPQLPSYSGGRGGAWIARGGVFALANIRGGGEFGPRWHEAALQRNRIKAFEDFIAVAEDLVRTRVTSPPRLGIMGGSQGGLLVGGCMTLRPELYGAVVSQVPLADMKRYAKLLAGASWMAEYGDPDDPEQWAFIRTWSPYHLLRADARYPEPFYWTTTRDDRVHPGHARKMVARMEELGHPVLYYEEVEGGHGAGSVNRQTARLNALEYAYLWMKLKPGP